MRTEAMVWKLLLTIFPKWGKQHGYGNMAVHITMTVICRKQCNSLLCERAAFSRQENGTVDCRFRFGWRDPEPEPAQDLPQRRCRSVMVPEECSFRGD